METEAIDKLFLELSQITKAKTQREIALEKMVEKAFAAGCNIGYSPLFNLNKVSTEWDRFYRYHMMGIREDGEN